MRQASLEMLGEASHAYCNDAFPPYTNFRYALEGDIVNPAAGGLGGSPASPAEMRWLWPLADTDEDKVIVNGFTGVGAGQVGLFAKLNGTEDWTDPMASKPYRSATLPTPHPKTGIGLTAGVRWQRMPAVYSTNSVGLQDMLSW